MVSAVHRRDHREPVYAECVLSFLDHHGQICDLLVRCLRRARRLCLLLVSIVAYVVISLAYIPVEDLSHLIALRLLHRVTFGVGNIALVASVQSVFPAACRAEDNGYFPTATTVSTALGAFLAISLSQKCGLEAVSLAAAGMALMGLSTTSPCTPGATTETSARDR